MSRRISARIVDIAQALERGQLDPSMLTARLRRKVVQLYMEERSEVPARRLAEMLGITPTQVHRIRRRLVEAAAWDLDDLDVKALAARFRLKKEELQRRAMAEGQWAVAWKIECDFIDKMAELGFIAKAPTRVLFAMDMERRLKEFFDEFGVPTAAEFLRSLRELYSGNGRPPAERLLVAGDQPSGPARGPAEPDEPAASD